MHYFIDGYNLMFRLGITSSSLRSERERFIRSLYEKIQTTGLDVTIVFDAQNQTGLGSRSHMDFLEICFTDQGETADDYIINELASTPNPGQEIVVTSDRDLAQRARRLYAKSEAAEEFIKWLDYTYRKKKKQNPPEHSSRQAAAMPEELLDPVLEASTQKNINAYLEIFEKKSQKLSSLETKPSKKVESRQIKESDIERWQRIFENKLNKSDD